MDISLDQLRTFLAVYRAGSITHAARILNMAQPTVTAHIKSLEASAGRPLFERGARGVYPTDAADYFAKRVATPIDLLEDVVTGESADTPQGRVLCLGGPTELICPPRRPDPVRRPAGHPPTTPRCRTRLVKPAPPNPKTPAAGAHLQRMRRRDRRLAGRGTIER